MTPPNTPIDEPDNHIPPAAHSPDAPAAAPSKERRPNRTLAEKLEDLAASARARIDKLQAREMRLVQDLGKVRGELAAARDELSKIAGTADRTVSAPPQHRQANGAPF